MAKKVSRKGRVSIMHVSAKPSLIVRQFPEQSQMISQVLGYGASWSIFYFLTTVKQTSPHPHEDKLDEVKCWGTTRARNYQDISKNLASNTR